MLEEYTKDNKKLNELKPLTGVVGLIVSENTFLFKFSFCNDSMGANDPLGVATFDLSSMIGRLGLCKYEG